MRVRQRKQVSGNKHQPYEVIEDLTNQVFREIVHHLDHFVTVEQTFVEDQVYDLDVTVIPTELFVAMISAVHRKGAINMEFDRILERIYKQEDNIRKGAGRWPRDGERDWNESSIHKVRTQGVTMRKDEIVTPTRAKEPSTNYFGQPIKPRQPEDRDPAQAKKVVSPRTKLSAEDIEILWIKFKNGYCKMDASPVPNWFVQMNRGVNTVPVEAHEIAEYQQYMEYLKSKEQ